MKKQSGTLRVVSDPAPRFHPESSAAECSFIGVSSAADGVRQRIKCAARVNATTLITGDSGVGKELVARSIHEQSSRRDQPFVALNCAAIPESLLEAELFGHEPGAFTDARDRRRGAFERAHRGTLFLDEIGDLSLSAQPKLLRALESGEVTRVGGEVARRIDIRIVAATHQDLSEMVRQERFRSDLYYRLRVLLIHVTPLRARPEDIAVLVGHVMSTHPLARGRRVAAEAMKFLQGYNWPGNVRELKSALERSLTMSPATTLSATSFDLDPPAPRNHRLPDLLDLEWHTARQEFEAAYAERLLSRHGGNVRRSAVAAGLATRSFYKMLERLELRSSWRPRHPSS